MSFHNSKTDPDTRTVRIIDSQGNTVAILWFNANCPAWRFFSERVKEVVISSGGDSIEDTSTKKNTEN